MDYMIAREAPGVEPQGGPRAYYPPPRFNRRTAIIIAATSLTLAFLVYALLISLRQGAAPVRWSLAGATVRSATSTEVAFDVTLTGTRPAVCRVRATNVRSTVVGWADVRIEPTAGGTPQRITTVLSTTELAEQGSVQACRVL